ncbi:MAG: hypothetical protein WCE75_11380 [Terracidiphilus sp.]
MIAPLRSRFNRDFTSAAYHRLLQVLAERCGGAIEFRVAETPIFVPRSLLDQMASEGAGLSGALMADSAYLDAARLAIPSGYAVAAETDHPHFLTADFALVRDEQGELAPRLVEIQAFPSVYGYQAVLADAYREAFALPDGLGCFLGGVDEQAYWELLARTIVGRHDPENVALTEVDPGHQKTRADFAITARRLGIAVVDIARLEPVGNRLHYRNPAGRLVPIHRIYNRAIADELIARRIQLPFDLARPWDVEWAGHPNWYFLVSKFSLPWLCRTPGAHPVVPPAAFLDDFLRGPGRELLVASGVPLPAAAPGAVYGELLLKPLFSFAGKGIHFAPTQEQLEAISPAHRPGYLLQQRMSFVPTIDTPHGPTQAEIRILYLWPDGGSLTPVLSLVRLGRGKMMGVDHNRNQEWVGASAAFFPENGI